MALSEDTMRRALWALLAGEVSKSKRNGGSRSLWWRVSRLCGMGGTAATALCVELGFDPDTGEVVRERGWEPAP